MVKPMLAAPFDGARARFPMIVTPKIDGIRVMIKDGQPIMRSGAVVPNEHIRAWAKANAARLNGVDGEIVVGKPNAPRVFSATQSGVTTRAGKPQFTFHAFDRFDQASKPYAERRVAAAKAVAGVPNARAVPAAKVLSQAQLERLEGRFVKSGFEGAIARDPSAPYKQGRSTAREGGMLKLKRFSDAEARITGAQEMVRGGRAAGTLGALQAERAGVKFSIGTGFTEAERAALWAIKDKLPGQAVRFKHMESGAVTAPRQPVFAGLRSALDMDSKMGTPKAAAVPSARTLARVDAKIAGANFGGLTKAAMGFAVGGAIYAAAGRQAEAGQTVGRQVAAAASEGTVALARTAGVTAALTAGERAIVHAAPSLAVKGARALLTVAKFGMPVVGLAAAGWGAYQGYKASGSIKGAALGAFTGGYVPPSMRLPANASGPVPPFAPSTASGAAPGATPGASATTPVMSAAAQSYRRTDSSMAASNALYWNGRARTHDVLGEGNADTMKSRPAARTNGAPQMPATGAFISPAAEKASREHSKMAPGRTTGLHRQPKVMPKHSGPIQVKSYQRNGVTVKQYERQPKAA